MDVTPEYISFVIRREGWHWTTENLKHFQGLVTINDDRNRTKKERTIAGLMLFSKLLKGCMMGYQGPDHAKEIQRIVRDNRR